MLNRSISGSETEKNLMKAFAGESQARNRYTYYASQAKKEGYEQISAIFIETADNEKEHAERFFKFLGKEPVTIEAPFLTGFGTTGENLEVAIMGEYDEWSNLYPHFGRVAEKEGFIDIASTFYEITKVEIHHEARYKKLLENLRLGLVFKRDTPQKWKCRSCGYIYDSTEAPEKCPACLHPRAYYELLCDNF